jgi:hypothetical protein
MPASPIRFATPQCRPNRSRTCGARARRSRGRSAADASKQRGASQSSSRLRPRLIPGSFASSLAAERLPLVGLARLDAAPDLRRHSFVMIMDRSVIQERLAETEEQIANGENQIAQQRRLIAELETNGSPASHAKYLLAGLELLQTARRDSRDWPQKQLGGQAEK